MKLSKYLVPFSLKFKLSVYSFVNLHEFRFPCYSVHYNQLL